MSYSSGTMTIEWTDNNAGADGTRLPPLKPYVPPAIEITDVLAVDDVTLYAGSGTLRAFKDFYGSLLGFEFVEADAEAICFRRDGREVKIVRLPPIGLEDEVVLAEGPPRGKLLITVRQFGVAIQQLQQRQISYELLHTDGGIVRLALLQDPGGNWLHLMETRPL